MKIIRYVGALLLAAGAVLLGQQTLGQQASQTVTDIAGRNVKIIGVPKRIMLGEGRLMYTFALLERPNPFARLLGWSNDMVLFDPDAWGKYKSAYPDDAKRLIDYGPTAGDFPVEKVITDNADLVLFPLSALKKQTDTGVVSKLEKSGIPVLFLDVRENPMKNTLPTVALLGKVLGRDREAREFTAYYKTQLSLVTRKVATKTNKPVVFVDRAAGFSDTCCATFGPFNYGNFVELAGGINWGSSRFANTFGGDVNPEAIITSDPDVILMTGANWGKTKNIPLGYDAEPVLVQERLTGLAGRTGFNLLKAVKNKQFYGVYHQFYNSPYHIFAIQQIAKWLYPEDFKTLNPEKNFADFHKRFLPFGLSGMF